jgi:hypothetical protein
MDLKVGNLRHCSTERSGDEETGPPGLDFLYLHPAAAADSSSLSFTLQLAASTADCQLSICSRSLLLIRGRYAVWARLTTRDSSQRLQPGLGGL